MTKQVFLYQSTDGVLLANPRDPIGLIFLKDGIIRNQRRPCQVEAPGLPGLAAAAL